MDLWKQLDLLVPLQLINNNFAFDKELNAFNSISKETIQNGVLQLYSVHYYRIVFPEDVLNNI